MKFVVVLALLIFAQVAAAAGVTVVWRDNSGGPSTCYPGSTVCDAEDGFEVERNGAIIAKTGPNTTTFFDALGVVGDVFRVRAFNSLGSSAWAGPSAANPPGTPGGFMTVYVGTVLTLPQDLVAKIVTSQVQLSWTKPTDTAVTCIHVERQVGLSGSWIPISECGPLTVNPWNDAHPVSGDLGYHLVILKGSTVAGYSNVARVTYP